ncbi:MAG: hypothetical protein ACFFBD_07340 [Candidatus Hodarchaeota archaeon]
MIKEFSYVLTVIALANIFLLLYTLILRWRQTHVKALLFLIGAYFLYFLQFASVAFFNFLTDFLIYYGVTERIQGLLTTTTYLGISAIFGGSFLLFIDYFENEQISIKHLMLIIGYLVFVYTWEFSWFFLTFYLSFIGSDKPFGLDGTYFNFLTLVIFGFYFYIGSICPKTLQNMKKYAIDSEHRKQLSYMQWAIFVMFFLSTLITTLEVLFEASIRTFSSIFFVLQYLSVIIGTFLFWLNYARSSRIALLQPQRIDKLLVLNESGLPLLSYEFTQTDGVIDESLITSSLTAVRSLLKEAIGTTSELRSITFGDREVMFIAMETFGVILFANRRSRFLQGALENFGKTFKDHYEDKIKDYVRPADFKDAEILVKKAFGLARDDFPLFPWVRSVTTKIWSLIFVSNRKKDSLY